MSKIIIICLLLISIQLIKGDEVEFDLKDKDNNHFDKLDKNKQYIFYLNTTKFSNINCIIKMSSTNQNAFNYLYLYEYSNKTNSVYNSKVKKDISIKVQGEELYASFNYSISNFETNYLALSITPEIDLDYLNITIKSEQGYYELKNGDFKFIYALKENNIYYFFNEAKQNQNANIYIVPTTFDNSELKDPFYIFEIYEYSNKSENFITRKIINYTKESMYGIMMNYNYKIIETSTNFLAIKVIPKKNISNMMIQITVKENSYPEPDDDEEDMKSDSHGSSDYNDKDKYNDKSTNNDKKNNKESDNNTIIAIFSIIPLTIFIIIILIICCIKCSTSRQDVIKMPLKGEPLYNPQNNLQNNQPYIYPRQNLYTPQDNQQFGYNQPAPYPPQNNQQYGYNQPAPYTPQENQPYDFTQQ